MNEYTSLAFLFLGMAIGSINPYKIVGLIIFMSLSAIFIVLAEYEDRRIRKRGI